MIKKIVPVVIAAIKKDNKFLMTQRINLDPEDYKRYHGSWQLPGGGMNFGETPEAALCREIKEEVGVEIKNLKFLPKIYTRIRKNWQGIFMVYLCELADPKSKIILDNEASDYGWYSIDEAKKLRTIDGTTEIIKDTL